MGLGTGPIVLAAENDLLWAEALIRSGGSLVTAAALIDNTHVGRGGLTSAAGLSAAAMLDTLHYEQDVELPGSNAAPYYNQRRLDKLEPLTPHEMPVPAKELGVLQLPLYTWGGASNPPNSTSTAPAGSAAALIQNAPRVWAEIRREQQNRLLANRVLNRLSPN